MSFNVIRNCIPLVLAVAVTLHSCSIKEDREVCPCWLTIQTVPGGGSQSEVCWSLWASDAVRQGVLDVLGDPSCTVEVPRETIRLVAVSGAEGLFSAELGLMTEEGEQYPPVYYYSSVLDSRCESLRDTILLHKNHVCINIQDGNSTGSFRYRIVGNVCGFGPDGQILPGPFSSQAEQSAGSFICRVPRQADGSLRLDVYQGSQLTRSFPLGEIIEMSGFDWTAEDLEDIDLTLYYTATEVTFTVNGWQHKITFYYEF